MRFGEGVDPALLPSGAVQVACHLQTTAAACWAPKTITDDGGNNFSTSGEPGLWLDQASKRLYVYATRRSDGTGGVVCVEVRAQDLQCDATAQPRVVGEIDLAHSSGSEGTDDRIRAEASTGSLRHWIV